MSFAMPIDQTVANLSVMQNRAPRPGRMRAEGLSESMRNFAIFTHLSSFLGFVFPPLILSPLIFWLTRRDSSSFIDDHGREAVNFVISFFLWHIILTITVIGAVFIPVIWVVGVISVVRGAIASGNGEYFRYPMTIRFLS